MGEHTDQSNYGYTPSPSWALAYIVLFSVSAAVHVVQAWRYKYWIIYPTLVLGALTEVLGWSARYWSSQNVTLLTPFLMQISTLIMAPVFFSAFDYVILGLAIKRLGPQYSVLRPNWYFFTFITADLISLILQAVGGGQASSSAAEGAPTQSATNIMVAGIIFQLVAMATFMTLGADFIIRATMRRPYKFQERWTHNRLMKKQQKRRDSEKTLTARAHLRAWWIMLIAVAISSTMILIRGVYRSVELVQGWTGHLMETEMYQNILDALMMLIAVGIYNFIHPGFLFPRKTSWKGYH
ncbi:hypothetical protein I317_05638 [Kwoniella heveanensis CBS 569]|uniref:RTA1 like protein n=1 Tax=Kwoniella heveanensis BCC8398 TaxID=1296120 RepID=A0A1B9GSZ0_9TREE|nr:hypothetical protein I316_04035 [Kwoniella heveanensis BCC8398]OCF40547.1 hypothetical protein I317_05638 [Kwoniella heveanensis CBS 569]